LVDGPPVAHFGNGKATFQAPTADELMRPIPKPPEQPPPRPQPPPPPLVSSPAPPEAQYLTLVEIVLDVLAARLHALLALLAATALWGSAMWAPDVLRIAAAGLFSGLVFLPTIWVWWYTAKGEK
jgi:hypothetical protein